MRIKKKSFTELRKYLLNRYFFWQYCREPYLEPNQKSMVELFCKNSQQILVKKEANSYFYIILYDFINCPAFVVIKQTLH